MHWSGTPKVAFAADPLIGKKYSLLKDEYIREDRRIRYFHSKSLNMRSEWGNIKECNKNLRVILNIRGRGGQLMMNL